jgi:hypothetical protein
VCIITYLNHDTFLTIEREKFFPTALDCHAPDADPMSGPQNTLGMTPLPWHLASNSPIEGSNGQSFAPSKPMQYLRVPLWGARTTVVAPNAYDDGPEAGRTWAGRCHAGAVSRGKQVSYRRRN